jgi:hypothetical protein
VAQKNEGMKSKEIYCFLIFSAPVLIWLYFPGWPPMLILGGNTFSILGKTPSQVQFIVLVSYPLPLPSLDVSLDYFIIYMNGAYLLTHIYVVPFVSCVQIRFSFSSTVLFDFAVSDSSN